MIYIITNGQSAKERQLCEYSIIEIEKNYKDIYVSTLNSRRFQGIGKKVDTSTITFRVVSAPREKWVPGTLLLIVAGMTIIGILNDLNKSLAFANCNAL